MSSTTSVAQIFREIVRDLFENKAKLLASSVVLNIFSSAIAGGLLFILFRAILIILGEPNINFSNFSHFLASPLAILLFVVYAIIVAFFLLLEFSILTFLAYSVRYKKHIRFHRTIYNALRKLKTVIFNPQFLLFVIYFILLIPLAGGGISPFLLSKIRIPQFIIGELLKSPQNAFLVFFGFLTLVYLNFRFIFALPILVLKRRSFLQSLTRSWQVSGSHHKNIIGSIALFEITVGGILVILSVVIGFLGKHFGISNFAEALIAGISFVHFAFLKIFVIDLLIRILSDEKIIHEKHINSDKISQNNKIWFLFVGMFSVVFVVNNLLGYVNFSLNSKVKIIAHRGFAKTAVENSIESLRSAKKLGVDLVETDVQITKDDQFVIFHDFSLRRLAGEKTKISKMTLAEIQQKNIAQNGFKSKIPTLEEFVSEADKLDMPLIIEMKVEPKNRSRFIDKFISKIKEMNLSKKHKIMSLDEKLAANFERIMPEFETGLVVPFQFGNFDLRKPFDFYAVEEFSFDNDSAARAISEGKEVFVWTVNDAAEIPKYFGKNSSGIITDESEKAVKTRDFFRK